MSHNLNLLRQNYCRPATVTGRTAQYLFPLEQECDQGKIFLAKAPVTLLHLQEFDPSGLEQTYRDEPTGVELPVFAVFDLDGDHQINFEITAESVPTVAGSNSLSAHLSFKKTQALVKKIHERRIKAERWVIPISGVLGILPALINLFATISVVGGGAAAESCER